MSDTQQTQAEESTPARHAGRVTPNLVTSETIAAMYSTPDPAKQGDSQESVGTAAKAADKPEEGGKDGKRNRVQERISELVHKRREAEAKAEAAERSKTELEARLKALEVRAAPGDVAPRPERNAFADDEQFIEALSEWKADAAIRKREKQQEQAQAQAAQTALERKWAERQERVRAEVDDYAEVISASKVNLPTHMHQAILESDQGPYLAYYFAKHPEEAKRFEAMTPTTALRQLGKLEDALEADDEPVPTPVARKTSPAVEISKAPPPIRQVRETASAIPGPAKNFEDYRAQRLAQRRR
jgi:hypothetical protein